MDADKNNLLPIINKNYTVTYKNEYDQVEVFEGTLIHPDLNGFAIFNVNNQGLLIPKDRIYLLRESMAQSPIQSLP